MASFNVDIVIGGVKDELTRATHSADNKFDADLAAWQERKSKIESARDKVRRALSKLVADELSIQEKARILANLGGRYDSDVEVAKSDIPVIPQRVRSSRERSLEHVIATLESSTDKTVTLTDLRAFGVLEFVKYSTTC